MVFNFNDNKIISFYNSVIKYYPSNLQETYWGTEEDVTKAVKEEYYVEEDDIGITLKTGRLLFPKALFEFLFTGEEFCVFDSVIGSRFNYRGLTFIELNESPVIRIETEEEIHPGLFPITSDDSGNTQSCFFVNDENDISYPYEIIPFFVAQLQNRLNKSLTSFSENFLHHFEPIKYAIIIEQDQNNLLIKLLYKLAAELGLIENKIDECNKIYIKSIGQNLANILDDITNENFQNLLPLNCFISAIGNTNPYYRYIDIYHIFESLFYKHFYTYVKNLPVDDVSKKTYKEIKDHVAEEKMLKLVLKNSLEDSELFRKEIKSKLLQYNAEKLLNRLGENFNINDWKPENNDEFAQKLASMIYKLRNAIAHSGETEKHIERINEDPSLTENFNNISNIIKDISKKTIDKNIDVW